MRGTKLRQIFGRDRAHFLECRHARLLEYFGGKRVREDQKIAWLRPIVGRGLRHLVEAIGDLRRIADRAVAGDRPRGRRPDDDRRAAIGFLQRLETPVVAERERDRKLHPDRVRGVILVFDLGFGERGLLDHAPHHRLRAAIERAVRGELHQLARDLRLGREAHRGVGMLPVALDAEALELLALHAEPVLREGAAFGAEFVDRHRVLVLALGAVLLLDLPFDRQAMAVPARHVVRSRSRASAASASPHP